MHSKPVRGEMIEIAVAVEVAVETISVIDGELDVVTRVRVRSAMPAQDERLVQVIEETALQAGQRFMREYYRKMIEQADKELILRMREGKAGKGIQLFGNRRYSFKTRFGTVVVNRTRIRYKSDGSTEVPSARVWGTPRQVMITDGLKKAVCEIVVKESMASTGKQIARESGEAGLLSKSTIGNILHREGGALAAAQQARAEKVLAGSSTARSLLGRAAAHIAEPYFEAIFLNGAELESEGDAERVFDQIVWDPYEELVNEQNKQRDGSGQSQFTPEAVLAASEPSARSTSSSIDERLVARAEIIAQMDEVVVAKQPGGKRERVVHYNGSVKSGEETFYCSGSTSAQLICQMGAVLARLGVHKGDKGLLVLSDCTSWITNWANGIGITDKEAVMCWWHLRDRCRELVGEAFTNRSDRELVRKIILKYLWRGQTDKAVSYLKAVITDVEDGNSKLSVKGIGELAAIKNYLIKRQRYIADYQARRKSKEWIASTQVEKFNDIVISARCKGNGQRWSSAGVLAIAALETARRNGELESWYESKRLPAWPQAA